MAEKDNNPLGKDENLEHESIGDKEQTRAVTHLPGMYRDWFLDYASYVILERAVPHIDDGLKPVQRRILHSMKRIEDGRYNKVSNIVGHTMQFHPHGDASIGDALVQLGQKDLLIDTQGNWGNLLTGDSSAAPRYIEARLSKFALETVFNPKTTEWKKSYDGRNKEPITLPVKFPLLLMQGVEGIAVGLSSKILPHNFNELLDAAIAYLEEKPFTLYPDFQSGGFVDVSRYNDGERGGNVKVRAKIEKLNNKTLVINELPFGKTTISIIESILKANDKGTIKIKKIDDNTAKDAEILIHLPSGVSSDKTIDALYAFTECEVSISPNCCVIKDDKPHFLTVSDVLKHNTDHTLDLLKTELIIAKQEQEEALFFASLEQIFIEERIYKAKEFENAVNMDAALDYIDSRLEPFKPKLIREVTRDDLLRLTEIKMARILKFNAEKNHELIKGFKAKIKEMDYNLNHIVAYTIDWFKMLKEHYGAAYPRRTVIRNFETIEVAKVAENNEKLYINREEGFIGTSLKKDEYICDCSDLDDVILFFKDGTYKVVKVEEKTFVGKGVIHAAIYMKGDKRTIYNVVYKDGKSKISYIKRFNIPSIIRNRDYDLTQGNPGSKVTYFSANPNGEAEIIKINLKPEPKRRILSIEKDFSEVAIKGRNSKGNILTKFGVQKITLKERGIPTIPNRKVWFDKDVLRINYDEQGTYIGSYQGDDRILVVLRNAEFYTTDFDLNNHYLEDTMIIEKFDADKVWTAVYYDPESGYTYLKRFTMESLSEHESIFGSKAATGAYLFVLTDEYYPRFEVSFGGKDKHREPIIIDGDDFVGVKTFRAKGKRLSNYKVAEVIEIEPIKKKEPENKEPEENEDESSENVAIKEQKQNTKASKPLESNQDILDKLTGQMTIFDNEK